MSLKYWRILSVFVLGILILVVFNVTPSILSSSPDEVTNATAPPLAAEPSEDAIAAQMEYSDKFGDVFCPVLDTGAVTEGVVQQGYLVVRAALADPRLANDIDSQNFVRYLQSYVEGFYSYAEGGELPAEAIEDLAYLCGN